MNFDIANLVDVIPEISTGIGLVSFALVIALLFFYNRNRADLKAIRKSSPENLPAVLERLEGRVPLPSHKLSGVAQKDLILEQMKSNARTKLIYAALIFVFSLVFVYLALRPPESESIAIDDHPYMGPGIDLAYAAEHLGVPASTGRCDDRGFYYPVDYYAESLPDEDLDCATFLTDDFRVYMMHYNGTVVSTGYAPATDRSEQTRTDIDIFFENAPDWLHAAGGDPPRTYGEFLDGFFIGACDIVGDSGSGVLTSIFGIYCNHTGSSRPPGHSAWTSSLSPFLDDMKPGKYYCYIMLPIDHDPDDPHSNLAYSSFGENDCIEDFGYDPSFDRFELMEWVRGGLQGVRIIGYGIHYPGPEKL